jgi:uncharacterized protein
MIFKIVIFIVVAYLVYKFFFAKKKQIGDETKQIEEELVSCPKCGIYIAKDEAILSNGKYYCSEHCLRH